MGLKDIDRPSIHSKYSNHSGASACDQSTPSLYVSETFQTQLSAHPWQLCSITHRQTKATIFDIDQFWMAFHPQLILKIDPDDAFQFTDVDGDRLTGSLHISGNAVLTMEYDQVSQIRASRKSVREDGWRSRLVRLYQWMYRQSFHPQLERYANQTYLGDLHPCRPQQPASQYLTTYVHLMDWPSIQSFSQRSMGPQEPQPVLELYSETHLYQFTVVSCTAQSD